MAQHTKLKRSGIACTDARVQFISMLQLWCPLYGALFFTVRCQLDEHETEKVKRARGKKKARQGKTSKPTLGATSRSFTLQSLSNYLYMHDTSKATVSSHPFTPPSPLLSPMC